MLNWLIDNAGVWYVLLAIAGIILAVLVYRFQDRRYVIGLAVVGGLALVLALLDGLVESDRQQIVRKVRAMAAAVEGNDLDGVMTHVSDRFRIGKGNKETLRRLTASYLSGITSMDVWDFSALEFSQLEVNAEENPAGTLPPSRQATVRFLVHVQGPRVYELPVRLCVAQFVLDADQQWRLSGFQIHDPLRPSDRPLPIPGLSLLDGPRNRTYPLASPFNPGQDGTTIQFASSAKEILPCCDACRPCCC
ncbi:MAG: hypothetical protein ACK4RK_14290 [Gemmataceae bacterium]